MGIFFSFDGIDGVGKSTQIELFCAWLHDLGHAVVRCRDPGSTPLGERVRRLLLDHTGISILRRAEMLLYMAARAQLVDELIRPALAAGQTVVSDRFLLANLAYQGYDGDLGADDVRHVGTVATAGCLPDLNLLLDLEVGEATARLQRARDRMESRGPEYLARVRAGFLAEAARDPQHIVVIDAGQPVAEVQTQIRQVVLARSLVTPPVANGATPEQEAP